MTTDYTVTILEGYLKLTLENIEGYRKQGDECMVRYAEGRASAFQQAIEVLKGAK